LSQGHFRLAVPGQFKRGKSTLLHALLVEAILPTQLRLERGGCGDPPRQ
jgi:hypothetical protein